MKNLKFLVVTMLMIISMCVPAHATVVRGVNSYSGLTVNQLQTLTSGTKLSGYEEEDIYLLLNDKQVRTIKKAIKELEQKADINYEAPIVHCKCGFIGQYDYYCSNCGRAIKGHKIIKTESEE